MEQQNVSDGQAKEQDERQRDPGTAAEANGAAAPDQIDLEAVLAERDSYLEQLQRSRADFANFRRRTEQDWQQARERANRALISKLLPVVDDFQRALEAVPVDKRETPWITGLTLIERKLWDILEKEGLQPIPALGQQFDPALHEAIASDPDHPGDTVIDVFQTGYRLGDGVLRPAMVRVGAPPTNVAGVKPEAHGRHAGGRAEHRHSPTEHDTSHERNDG